LKKPSSLRPGFLLLAGLALCGLPTARAEPPADLPPLLVVSLDGCRWDYPALHPAEAAHLRRYAAEGISARELIPVYPSNTFPNHYAIATGLYPAHNGVINNDMFDPKFGAYFRYTLPGDTASSRWWGGEPIWVTAIKQGRKSASYYWVGSEAPVAGVLPTYTKRFNMAVYTSAPFQTRIDEVARWLQLPPDQRPAVIMFYIEETNSAGHKFGPDSPELAAALQVVDGRLGALMDRLRAEHLPVNLIVVSDHGMTPVSPERVIFLDDYVDPKTVQIDFQSPEMGLRPLQGTAKDLLRALAHLPHAKAYLTDNQPPPAGIAGLWHGLDRRVWHRADYLPARFHLTGNPRIPDIWLMPDLGWHIQTRALAKTPASHNQKADHGYDPRYQAMHGILIADGPSFKTGGQVIAPVPNVDIYNLMCAALHLTPAPNDGDDTLVRAFLR
jgi:predicted AlkP superfamily pyrophosphatase or phosphodiesterase